MKILFWILALLSLPVGCFISFVSYMSHGLGLAGTGFGEIVLLAGMLSLGVCIAGVVLGILALRKGNAKRAVAFALMGWVYAVVILVGYYLDDAMHTKRLEESIAQRQEQMYGEGWDAAPAIEGIPELYQEVLNKFYVMVEEKWPAGELMDIGAVAMADYYGDVSTDNIGFALVDLNGDGVDELVIGTVASEGEGTVIFSIYSDPENPHYYINSVEGNSYYLHSGADGAYMAEIVGWDAAWEIVPAEAGNTFDFNYVEGAMDPAGRLMLELIPFSRYK